MRTAVLVSVLGIVACTDDEPVEIDTQDIINGDPIPASELPFAGMVRIVTPQGTGICSGSLLSDRVVLTAAHCIPADENWSQISFTTSANLNGAVFTPVVDGRVQYFWNPSLFAVFQRGDIALLKLATPMPKPQYPALIADPGSLIPCITGGPCHALTIVGYGQNGNNVGTGTKRVGSVAFYAWVNAAEQELTTPSDFQEVRPWQTLQEQLCPGDSGGPAFVRAADGRPILTGVAHAVFYDPAGGTCNVQNIGMYSSVHPYSAWIIAKAGELAGLYGDLDRNGIVDVGDLNAFGVGLRKGTYDPVYDIDNDGDVDLRDADEMVFRRVKILYGDIDGDGLVDGGDFLRWQRLLGMATGKWTDGDMNFDGKTDGKDLDAWKANFGRTLSSLSSESSGLGLSE